MAAFSNIVVRIHTPGDAVDWSITHPSILTFKDTLTAIHQVIPDNTIQAFEYEDEDGDRITVRSDEELITMVQSHVAIVKECDRINSPLEIYPKIGKTPTRRNIHGLKVKTSDGESNPVISSGNADSTGSGSRKRSGDIREILSGGNISDTDLQFVAALGSGNCGTVYKAVHQRSNTPMAVKVINLDITEAGQKQIMSELEVLYRCNYHVIIGFYGAYFVENRISICTEFMDGGSLDKYGQIEEPILGRISVSIVKGLQYLWSLKIMHRDVKPSNILINTQGEVKLCDFGVSVQLIDSIARTYIGTNAYMAPERIQGEQYSIHSDVWSLGVSLFELATSKFPYESAEKPDAKPLDLMNSIVGKEPPQLPKEAFSAAFVHFVSHCMTKNPLNRPAPQALMRDPFIQFYNDDKKALVAAWVQRRIQLQQMTTGAG